MNVTRRELLAAAGMGLTATMVPRGLLAQDASTSTRVARGRPTLVCIYLRGGQDALNVVVPYAEDRYYELRPRIAIARKEADGVPGVVKLDDRFGLHPALSALEPFWKAKTLAPIVNVGSPHETRSHFDAQDFMEYAAPGVRTVRSGWLNRYLEATRARVASDSKADGYLLRAVAMQGLLPRSLRG